MLHPGMPWGPVFRPLAAVPFVQQVLAVDPLSANAWQDVARVYGRSLGIPLD